MKQVYVPAIWRGDFASPVDALANLGFEEQDAIRILAGAPHDGIHPIVLQFSQNAAVALIITPEGLTMLFDLYMSMRSDSQAAAHRASIKLASKEEYPKRSGIIACNEAELMTISPAGSTTVH